MRLQGRENIGRPFTLAGEAYNLVRLRRLEAQAVV